MKPIVRAAGLGRFYGEVVGLNDLTVDIEPGITGLIGPNGAGKSTFMKILVGEIRPSRGAIEVLGEVPFANQRMYRRMGFCPQQDALYGHVSGREFVASLLRLAGYGRSEARALATRSMERVQLADAMDRRIASYSKGMRQRTKLAQSIAHDPQLLVVDEPLTGLDPVARHHVLELFGELGEAGTSIIISSHVLHEVQSLTSTIVLIHRGRLLAEGSVSEVRRLLSHHPRQVRLRARAPRALARALLAFEHIDAVRLASDGEGLAVDTRDLEALLAALPSLVAAERPGISSLESTDASLEAVFDYLVV